MIAADINGDGETEIVAADTRGNVAAFTPRGKEVWERHLASLIAQVLNANESTTYPHLAGAMQMQQCSSNHATERGQPNGPPSRMH